MRIMLDTMIYDAIVANPEAMRLVMFLTEKGTLNIVTTHIQEDQLAGIIDDAKRRAVLSIPTSKVTTNGAVWNLSKWDECTWGSDKTDTAINDLIKCNPKHAPDALIGVTASSAADILVTADKQLTARIKVSDLKLKVLDFEGFVNLLRVA
jgi:predicted nucleic acid-binding protein